MNAIEPNWLSLIWFTMFATTGAVAFLVVAGKFPLDVNFGQSKSALVTGLVIGNAILMAVLLAGTGVYGYTELRWTTLIVVAGLIFLFAPALVEEWRWPLRNTAAELGLLVGVQMLALAALFKVGGSPSLSCPNTDAGAIDASQNQADAFSDRYRRRGDHCLRPTRDRA